MHLVIIIIISLYVLILCHRLTLLSAEEISWTEHISKEEVEASRKGKIPVKTIRTRQRKWMGHIMREDLLEREIIEGRMEGKRGRGRPRKKLLDWVMSEGYSKLKEEAQHRDTLSHWRPGPARGQKTQRRRT